MKTLLTLLALGSISLLSPHLYSQYGDGYCPTCNNGNGGYYQQQSPGGYSQGYGGNQYQPRGNQNYQQQNDRQSGNSQMNNYERSDVQKKADQNANDKNLNPDQAISQKVHDSLTGGWLSKGYQNVSYDISNGTVTLRGNVDSQDNKDSIDATIKKIDGVKQVNNQITVVKPDTNKDSEAKLQASEKKYPRDTAASFQDRELNAKIRDKLSSGWFSKASDTIILRTQDGLVVITGAVEKPEDIQKVTDQVKSVDGVDTVNNQLQAKPKQQQ